MQILLYSIHFIWSISQRMQTRTLLNFKDLGTKRWRFNLQNDKLDKKIQKFYSCTETRLSAVLQTRKKKKFKSSIPVQRQDYLRSWAMIYLKKKQAPTIMPSLLIQTM